MILLLVGACSVTFLSLGNTHAAARVRSVHAGPGHVAVVGGVPRLHAHRRPAGRPHRQLGRGPVRAGHRRRRGPAWPRRGPGFHCVVRRRPARRSAPPGAMAVTMVPSAPGVAAVAGVAGTPMVPTGGARQPLPVGRSRQGPSSVRAVLLPGSPRPYRAQRVAAAARAGWTSRWTSLGSGRRKRWARFRSCAAPPES